MKRPSIDTAASPAVVPNLLKGIVPEAAGEALFTRQANKGILSEAVAQELDVPRRTAARILDAVLDSIQDLLRSRGKVAVKGFGTFERKIRKGRAYKHPLTGESIDVADKETIIFKPSDRLIDTTTSDSAPGWRRVELTADARATERPR